MTFRRAPLFSALTACTLLALIACASDEPASAATKSDNNHYTYTQINRDGIGKFYMGREISHVMGHQGARWLDRPERVTEERTDLAIDNLPISPGDSVADIGAGSGYFSFRMSERVGPTGQIYAVDIQPEMLAIIEKRALKKGIDNISLVAATAENPGLPPESIDMALFVDVYHELEWPREVMLKLVESLKPGGKVVLLEYRMEDPAVPILKLHKMTEAQVSAEMQAVGLNFVENGDFLPRQHFLVFAKPEN
jgi:ubiquinone/menaquinone biosynthesis C-methylase UbiE